MPAHLLSFLYVLVRRHRSSRSTKSGAVLVNRGGLQATVVDLRRRAWRPLLASVRFRDGSSLQIVVPRPRVKSFLRDVRRGSLVRFRVRVEPVPVRRGRRLPLGAVRLVAVDWAVEEHEDSAAYPRISLVARVTEMAVEGRGGVLVIRYQVPRGWVESDIVLSLAGGDPAHTLRRNGVIAISASVRPRPGQARERERSMLVCHGFTRVAAACP